MLSAASRFDTTEMSRVQSKAAHPAEVPRGTKLSESQLIPATQGHLIKRHSAEPTGIQASHNPEVAGSNPTPAMSLTTTLEPSAWRAFAFSKAFATASDTVAESSTRSALS